MYLCFSFSTWDLNDMKMFFTQKRICILQIHICHISTWINIFKRTNTEFDTKQHWNHPPAAAVRQSQLQAASPQGFSKRNNFLGKKKTFQEKLSWTYVENLQKKKCADNAFGALYYQLPLITSFNHPLITPSPRRWAARLPPRLWRAAPPSGARLLGHNSCSFGMFQPTLRWIKIGVPKRIFLVWGSFHFEGFNNFEPWMGNSIYPEYRWWPMAQNLLGWGTEIEGETCGDGKFRKV